MDTTGSVGPGLALELQIRAVDVGKETAWIHGTGTEGDLTAAGQKCPG